MRASTIAIAATIAAALTATASAQTVKTVFQNGPVNNRYDIVILGDGYQASEESDFDADAQAALNQIFANPAWGDYQQYFNAHTVFRASQQSGADHPDANPPIFVNTAYDASYNWGGTARCLYIGNSSRATSDALLAPDVEGRIIVLVNDDRYGGCASTFSVSYTGSSGAEVQAHEFGHSFGLLADEYDYGQSGTYNGPEPSSANITADSSGMAKWPLWLGTGGVSTFEGAGYYPMGMWRPENNCLMRSLFNPLCEVCEEQIVKQCYASVSAVDAMMPASPVAVAKPGSQVFSFTNIAPGNNTIDWLVDGAVTQNGGTSFTLDVTTLSSGSHTVTARVTDTTAYVRSDPSNRLRTTGTWNVDVTSAKPGAYQPYGTGCWGSSFPLPPILTADGVPEIGSSFVIQLSFGKPNSTASLVFGGSNTTWGAVPLPFNLTPYGAPGCYLRASLDVFVGLSLDGTGYAEIEIPLPNEPALVDGTFYNQAHILDPTANAIGYTFSNGMAALVGL